MTRTLHTIKKGWATCPHCNMLVETVIGRYVSHDDIVVCSPPVMTIMANGQAALRVLEYVTCKGSGQIVSPENEVKP